MTDLSWVLLLGAVTASIAHIFAGYWGDRWLARFGSRRGLIGVGLFALCGSYLWLAAAADVTTIVVAVVVYQIALNLFFAPLGALLVDYVPDERKGTVAGWLNAALPLASIFTAIIARLYPVDDFAGFLVVAAAVIACAAPLLILWPNHLQPLAVTDRSEAPPSRQVWSDFLIAWCARFLIQFGAAIVLGYLFAYLSLSMDIPDFPVNASAGVATLALVAAAAGFASAVGAGRLSDGTFGRLAPMTTGALCVAISFATLALTESWLIFVAAYAVCQIGLACFVTVDSALVAQLLHGHGRRGMWLGVMNLTNTLPGVFGPVLTLTVVSALSDRGTISALFLLSAVAALFASVIIQRIRSVR
ncbi:MFS transporter [Pontixanthobacter rizhaonensis]|uniref:MFS transporter n=1 Tax=Pontixanthobacter rizhaonensis TaxID=2730337 RepID=UPI00248353C0|nr:MFS transporter [Pontixanthobacter rizhaonensis]